MKMRLAVCLWILGQAAVVCLAGFLTQFAGPFNILVKQLADCENADNYPVKIIGNKIRKLNRSTYVYSAKVYIPFLIDDSVKLEARSAVFGNGGWKENYFVMDLGGMCTAGKTWAPETSARLSKNMNMGCPMQPGNYSLTNAVVNLDVKFPALQYNKYKVQLAGIKGGQIIGCKILYLDIVPKSKN